MTQALDNKHQMAPKGVPVMVRQRVLSHAENILAYGVDRDPIEVIAQRAKVSPNTVIRALVSLAVAGERYRRAREVADRNAHSIADQAFNSVFEAA